MQILDENTEYSSVISIICCLFSFQSRLVTNCYRPDLSREQKQQKVDKKFANEII